MNKPLGCLSRSGLLTSLLALVLVAAAGLGWGGSLFSPGPLNAQAGEEPLGGVYSHAETSGRCASCHVAVWSNETMSDRCLWCHADVDAQLRDPASLHGIVMAGDGNRSCYDCHPEHGGSNARLTVLDPDTFPHEATGYSLKAHEQVEDGLPLACTDCHVVDLLEMGLDRCGECHRDLDAAAMDAHDRAFGLDCLWCHDGLDTYGAPFDHRQTAFPLEGRHGPLACAGCHQEAVDIAALQDTPQECIVCHGAEDVHDGQLGADCAVCHSSEGWEQATFDHDQTGFALVGLHVDVDCEGCHQDNVYQGALRECIACHEADDVHEGQFGTDCAECHSAEGWEQATFDHSQTAFPLTGAHLETECARCHADGEYHGTAQDCAGCHDDPAFHLGLLSGDCASCHTTAAWLPASYDRAHTFPFDHGEQGTSPCRTCHPQTLSTYTCYECHEHDRVETESKHLEEGITDFQDCMRCHPTGQKEEGEEGDD